MNWNVVFRQLAPVSLVLVGVALGMLVGPTFGVHPARAASPGGKVVSFDTALGGELQVFSPGVSYKVVAAESGADFQATQIASVKRHVHNHSTEFFYVVSGSGTATLGAVRRPIVPGDMISIPAGTPHGLDAIGPPLRLVEVDVPSIASDDTHWLP